MRFDERIAWPNDAKTAVSITVDVDAELIWLDMDPGNVDRPKTLSMGQYGPKRGIPRILDVLDRFSVRATFFVPGRTAELYAQEIGEVAARGHEIGCHGHEHENFGLLSEAQQREVFEKSLAAIEKVCGVRPKGYRTPAGDKTAATDKLLQELGFTYSSSMRGDDRPYFIEIDGEATDLVEMPAHWELDDFPYFAFNYFPPFPAGQGRIAGYDDVLGIWQDEFDGYYKYGLNYMIMFHPQTIGTPGRIGLLEELLAYVTRKPDVWFCTGSELADFWRGYRSHADQRKELAAK
jgi:peptidoglycan/xylan/chitin deacetylase (PgdA/CDA1 family)